VQKSVIAGLGGAAAWPLAARAQQRAATPVIGFLHFGSPAEWSDYVALFREGLAETGYVEGRNVAIEYRWAEDHYDRLPVLADELVRRKVAVIAAPDGDPQGLAAKAATRTIPIVFMVGNDPVELGLVDSLNHPGGNATGVNLLNFGVAAKRLELLHEVAPTATLIAFLDTATNTGLQWREMQNAAPILGVHVMRLAANSRSEIDAAFASLVQQRVGALVINAGTFFFSRRDQIAALAARYALPAIFAYREQAAAGGLMTYGTDVRDATRQVGVYTGRILSGDKPADLPVQRSTKIELVINMKAAKALGLTFPTALLVRADEVIE
jgi:putative tryptophan/tyrosine transport system substrate-binding protein